MERIRYFNVETLSDLSKVKFSGDPGDTTYFTYSDTTLRQGAPDVAWHGVCTVAPVGQVYSHGKFYFPGRSGYSGTVYGVQWDTTDPSPECTRIGNMSLHATLPVQSQMVGGLMLDDGTFNEFGDQSDWTSYTRDGSLGQVMVKIPTFWIKFETLGNIYRVLMSAVPVVGFKTVREMYVSAYEASLDRTNLKLSSVVNKTAQYRGGNNNSAWDNEDTAGEGGESHRSLLGRPVTAISLTDFRTYARNRGSSAWNCYFYLMQKTLYWLYVCEYATLNSQKAYDASTTSEGYRKGGLGDGVSTWDGTSWNNFNGYRPLVSCGWTDSLGNGSGVRNYTVYNAAGTSLKTFAVPRYRGIENPWGHIWKHTDGILCQVYSGTDGVSQVYATDNPADFSSTSYSAYRLIGNEMRTSNYVMQLHLGEYGDITAKSGNGNSTSYYCDYHYTAVSSSSLRAVLFGGSAYYGSSCGFVSSYSNYAPSFTTAAVGSRLCYFDALKDVVYEEHEWLIGDGSAYIDTKVSDLSTIESIYCYFIGNGIETQRVFGRDRIGSSRFVIQQANNQIRVYTDGGQSTDLVSPNNEEGYILIDYKNATAETKYNQGTIVKNTITTGPNLILFGNNWGTSVANFFTGKIHKFEIKNILSFTPCKLLQPIPAILDGNGIVRQAGECGMWDKVSNRFYGNVASTGKFTVEGQRLYEEFEWLKGDGNAYIKTLVTSYSGIIKVAFKSTESIRCAIFGREALKSDYTDRLVLLLFPNSNNKDVSALYGTPAAPYALVITDLNDEEITIDLNNQIMSNKSGNSVQINVGVNVTGSSLILFAKGYGDSVVNAIAPSDVAIKKFSVSDQIHLTPVRLLRPLPAYMDANGRPRAAGECGMWDKVSNKFYGNVASSGRFTVLNN